MLRLRWDTTRTSLPPSKVNVNKILKLLLKLLKSLHTYKYFECRSDKNNYLRIKEGKKVGLIECSYLFKISS